MAGSSDLEDPLDDSEGADAFVLLARYTESPAAGPWQRQNLRRKIVYWTDQAFLAFLLLYFCILLLEVLYKVCYLLPWRFIYTSLLTRGREEDLLEL